MQRALGWVGVSWVLGAAPGCAWTAPLKQPVETGDTGGELPATDPTEDSAPVAAPPDTEETELQPPGCGEAPTAVTLVDDFDTTGFPDPEPGDAFVVFGLAGGAFVEIPFRVVGTEEPVGVAAVLEDLVTGEVLASEAFRLLDEEPVDCAQDFDGRFLYIQPPGEGDWLDLICALDGHDVRISLDAGPLDEAPTAADVRVRRLRTIFSFEDDRVVNLCE
jgi:hypothetical protein